MRALLSRFHRASSSKPFRESTSATSTEESPSYSNRQHRFSLSSRATEKAIEPQAPLRSRKRDRLKNYLTRQRAKGSKPYLWPAMLSTNKEELQFSDDMEKNDDVYMVDYQSDDDSDDDSLTEDGYVPPPVAIPEMYIRQDRQGGITVAGTRILFTYAGFKRQQMMLGKLQSIPEAAQLMIPLGLHREYIVIGAY